MSEIINLEAEGTSLSLFILMEVALPMNKIIHILSHFFQIFDTHSNSNDMPRYFKNDSLICMIKV